MSERIPCLALGTLGGDVLLHRTDSWELLLDLQLSSPIGALVVSSDGTCLAVGTLDGRVRLYNVSTRSVLHEFECGRHVNCMVFNARHHMLVVGAQGNVLFYNLLGEQFKERKRESAVLSLALSPDGETLAIGERNGHVAFYDVGEATGYWRCQLAMSLQRRSWISGIAFAPDGKRFAAGSMGERAALYDISNEEAILLTEFQTVHCADVTCFAFTANGDMLAIGHSHGKVMLHDFTHGASDDAEDLPQELPPRCSVWAMAFAPDGKDICLGDGMFSGGGFAAVHDVATGNLVKEIDCKTRVTRVQYCEVTLESLSTTVAEFVGGGNRIHRGESPTSVGQSAAANT